MAGARKQIDVSALGIDHNTIGDQLDLEDFLRRGQAAQREVTAITERSDRIARSRPRARGSHPQTSHKAAKRAGNELTRKQEAVFECFQRAYDKDLRMAVNSAIAGGMADPQFIAAYKSAVAHNKSDWPVQSDSGLRTRRHELVEKGKLEKLGVVVERVRGKPFTLWGVKR
jgi:hypothetical protein